MRLSLISGVALTAVMAMTSFARADIVIGNIAPVTGPVAAYGMQVKNGVAAAAEAINAEGGNSRSVTHTTHCIVPSKHTRGVANKVAGAWCLALKVRLGAGFSKPQVGGEHSIVFRRTAL